MGHLGERQETTERGIDRQGETKTQLN